MQDQDLDKYIAEHTSYPGDVLQEIERNTHLKTLAPQMMSGHVQGRLLSMISHMIQPEHILEIGTFTAYSSICLAEGLTSDGQLDTIEVNSEYEDIINQSLEKSGLSKKIKVHYGNALEIITKLDTVYDLVFIDAAKTDYGRYYELVFPRVRAGGYILADNVLWSGKVIEKEKDQDTQSLHEFNERIQGDERLENILLPVRDGIMICRKR